MKTLLVASLVSVLFESPSPGSGGGPADPPAPNTPDTPAPGGRSPRLGDQTVDPPTTQIVHDPPAPQPPGASPAEADADSVSGFPQTLEHAKDSVADLPASSLKLIVTASQERLAELEAEEAAKAVAERPKWNPAKPAILLEDGRVVDAPSLVGDRLAHRAPTVKAAGVNYVHVSEVLETIGDVTFERWVYRQDSN